MTKKKKGVLNQLGRKTMNFPFSSGDIVSWKETLPNGRARVLKGVVKSVSIRFNDFNGDKSVCVNGVYHMFGDITFSHFAVVVESIPYNEMEHVFVKDSIGCLVHARAVLTEKVLKKQYL